MKKINVLGFIFVFFTLNFVQLFQGCSNKSSDNGLAPYEGQTDLSGITVESGTFRPKITWLGGYVSVLGVNRGSKAALDTSLVWLIYLPGNNIHFPVKYGTLPQGAQDLTASYGGKTADSLSEDLTYTYWVMKEDAWSQISAAKVKSLSVDSSLSSTVKITSDSAKISPLSLARKNQNIDVFINIRDVSTFGRLGDINVVQPKKNPYVTVSWTITESDVADTLLSAMGITEGDQYNETSMAWEVWSEDSSAAGVLYGKSNIIKGPVIIGQKIPGTKVFAEFPVTGLIRGRDYYLWIANKNWNGTDRQRFTPYYAYATFHVY